MLCVCGFVCFFVGTPLQEMVLNGKSGLQRATVCRPLVLNDFYSSQAHGRAVMYGGSILAFIVVFEWIHKEIGGLERGILPTVKKRKEKKMLSAPQVLVFRGKRLHRFNQA